MSSRGLSNQVAAAKSSRDRSRKKMKTHKDNTDNGTFVKDYKDFMMSVNKSLNSESDVTVIRNNLLNALGRINKLRKALKKYIVIKSGNYHTSKVPKLCYSTQGRPSYYKLAKWDNKNKTIPYNLEINVVVRKIRLSVIDDVSGKQVYKSGSIDFDSDTYNKFFSNLINVVFSNIKTPMEAMKKAFYGSGGFVFGSASQLSANSNISEILKGLFTYRDYYDEMSRNIISSTLKALMYGGVNKTTDVVNIKYFASQDFFEDFTNPSVTNLISREERFNMLYNLTLAYSYKYYKRSKSKTDLEVIACIRANIISIIRNMNRLNPDEISQDNYPSSFDDSGNLESMEISSTVESSVTTPTTAIPKLSSSNTDNFNPFGNLGKQRKFFEFQKQDSTSATGTRAYSTTSSSQQTYNNSSFGGKPIEYRVPSTSFIRNSNAYPKDTAAKNLIDTLSGGSNLIPPTNTVLYGPAGFNSPPENPQAGNSFFSFPGYNAFSDKADPFTFVTPSFFSNPNDYTSNVPSVPTGVNNITTFIDQLTNLFGILHMTVYHLIEMFRSGEGSNIPALNATFNALLSRAGLKQTNVPFADKTRVSMILSDLEKSINQLVEGGSVKKASYSMNMKSKELFGSAVNELKKLLPDTSSETKKQLNRATSNIKKYIDNRTNVNNLSLKIGLENTENQDLDTPEVKETATTISSLKNLKELVSIVAQVLPLPEGSNIGSSMMEMG